MVSIGLLNFDGVRQTDDVCDFTVDTIGVAEVEFEFPEGVEHPLLPVVTEYGLIWPRRGVSIATAPEIAVAKLYTDTMTIRLGFIIPWKDKTVRPFEAFARNLISDRESYKSEKTGEDGIVRKVDTVASLAVKTMVNGGFGKLGQGVNPRRAYDARSGEGRQIEPSPITCAAMAAYTTGLTRAAIGEILNGLPEGWAVYSVSTDGLLTDAPLSELNLTGPACALLVANRHLVSPLKPALVEEKRRAYQVFSPRSRAVSTTMRVEGEDSKTVTAQGSIKLPADVGDVDDYLTGCFLDRTVDTVYYREDMLSPRDQWESGCDLVRVPRKTRINLEPDFKRRLINPRMEVIGGGAHVGREHLATDSEPWDTAEQMVEARTLFAAWQHKTGRCLKTLEDFADWSDYYESTLAARLAGKRPYRTASGAAGDFHRQFLRALTRGKCGLSLDGMTYDEVAAWLTGAGYRTSVEMVKNSRREASRFVPNCVAVTEITLELLSVILARFPAFAWTEVFVAGQKAKVEKFLRSPGRRKSGGAE